MTKKIIAVVLVFAIALFPLMICIGIAFFTPSVYHNTFLAGITNKYSRLTSLESPKVVVIGGSNVAFGLNSQQMEDHLGLPVVNFGLYASLGSKVMLDLAKDAIKSGDIVVLAFETDNQTMSTYFNAEAMWQAIDCDNRLLFEIDCNDYGKMMGGLYDFVKNKLNFLREGAPDFEGVYHSSSFNEYGDICYSRSDNIMPAGFDTNNIIDFQSVIIEEAFIDYVNEFIEDMQCRGASVCFSFCPMNSLAIESADDTSKDDYVSRLREAFHCPIISEIDDYIYESDRFYDTNFHLNDYGAFFRTKQLAKDIAQYYDIAYLDIEPPIVENNKPNNDKEETVDDSAFANCFTYEDYYGAGLAISGVTDKAKAYTELAIPQQYLGQKVVAIMPNAFAGCDQLTHIRISRAENDAIILNNGAFSGADNLRSVFLDADPTCVNVSTEGLLDNTASKLTFYVGRDRFAKYVTDYYWSIYAEYIKIENG